MVANRRTVHAIVDELEDSKLELALRALEEIRGDEFELTEEEEKELQAREDELADGERIDARNFLSELRRTEGGDSDR